MLASSRRPEPTRPLPAQAPLLGGRIRARPFRLCQLLRDADQLRRGRGVVGRQPLRTRATEAGDQRGSRIARRAGTGRVLEPLVSLALDDVEPVGLDPAAERDIAPLARELVGREHERPPAREALREMTGDRVAELERGATMAVDRLQIAPAERDATRSQLTVSSAPRGSSATTVPRSPLTTSSERSLRRSTTRSPTENAAPPTRSSSGAESAGRAHQRMRASVEVGDVDATVRDHQRAVGIARRPPVSDQALHGRASRPRRSRPGPRRSYASTASAAAPERTSASASRSHSAACRRFSVSSITGTRVSSPRNAPPAPSSGSWRWSPTRTSFASAARDALDELRQLARRHHRRLVDHEHRSPRPNVLSGRRRSCSSSAVTLVLGIPAPSSSSRAARRASAAPSTRRPLASHASRAAPSANVLPGARLPDDDGDARRLEHQAAHHRRLLVGDRRPPPERALDRSRSTREMRADRVPSSA